MNYQIVNAFSQNKNGGNPAAVVVNGVLSQADKQELAKRIGFSETAFINEVNGNISIEFFTPEKPIPYCGHATIASVNVLKQQGLLSKGSYLLKTRMNPIPVHVHENEVYMEQQFPTFNTADPDEAARLLNIETPRIQRLILADNGVRFLLVEVAKEDTLSAIIPNSEAIYEYSKAHDLIGIYVFAQDQYHLLSRMFAPYYGIAEENATGMAAGLLAGWMYERSRGVIDKLNIEQGKVSTLPAPGFLQTVVKYEGAKKIVLVGGEATVLDTVPIEPPVFSN